MNLKKNITLVLLSFIIITKIKIIFAISDIDLIYDNIILKLPKKDFKNTIPNENQITERRKVIHNMLNMKNIEDCLNERLFYLQPFYKLVIADNKFCILYENNERVIGWGSFFSKLNEKNIHIQIPHPITDGNVHDQGFYLFKNSKNIKSLLLSGTTRDAELRESNCLSNYWIGDVSHNSRNLFQVTTMYIAEQIKKDIIIQLHGMSETTCIEDVFIVNSFLNK
jgi:hypothetical protein